MATTGRQIGLSTTVTLFLILCLPYIFIANEIYRPDDVYSISCGSSENLTVDGRNWTADINTKLSSSDSQNNHSVAANALIPTTMQSPYNSARLSYSQFKYSFPVTTSGHNFIRLFFYPTSYQNFDPTKAYFSVKSGEYTLLKDFNASLYADADYNPSDTFFLEYSVYVQDGHNTLNMTFLPSTAKNHMDSHYAFINGIEVVSMPPYLYHTKPDDYVGLQMVEHDADTLLWTSGQSVTPIVKDYAVIVPPGDQKITNISLKMSPLPKSLYADAVLDGLELFKINESQGNLSGPNPEPHPNTPSTPQVPLQKKSSVETRVTVAGAISGVLFLLVVIIVVFFLVKGRKKSNKGPKHKLEGSSSLPTNICRRFSIEEIRAATNNFDKLSVVGVGGFGNVYKGYIDNDATLVAIKRLKPGSHQGAHEFLNEIEMLSQLRHVHLVSLVGYCYESNEMILVYDFMARGTLCDHLYNTDNPSLSWNQRLKVRIGAAHGLHYLHTGVKHMIIHRDVKSTNILLDEKWVAKVSDFGISRVGPTSSSMTHVSTVVKGSLGYLDPEYYKRQRLTEKSDVYSFGVVLLEVLCGRPPFLRSVEKRQVALVNWARESHHSGTLWEIVDPALNDEIAPECLSKFGDLALSCLLDNGTERPSMNDVVRVLEFALHLQENSVSERVMVEGRGSSGNSDDMVSSNTSSSGMSMASGEDRGQLSKDTQWLMSESSPLF